MKNHFENYCGVDIYQNGSSKQLWFNQAVGSPQIVGELGSEPAEGGRFITVCIEPRNYFITEIGLFSTIKQSPDLGEIREAIDLYQPKKEFKKFSKSTQNLKILIIQ